MVTLHTIFSQAFTLHWEWSELWFICFLMDNHQSDLNLPWCVPYTNNWHKAKFIKHSGAEQQGSLTVVLYLVRSVQLYELSCTCSTKSWVGAGCSRMTWLGQLRCSACDSHSPPGQARLVWDLEVRDPLCFQSLFTWSLLSCYCLRKSSHWMGSGVKSAHLCLKFCSMGWYIYPRVNSSTELDGGRFILAHGVWNFSPPWRGKYGKTEPYHRQERVRQEEAKFKVLSTTCPYLVTYFLQLGPTYPLSFQTFQNSATCWMTSSKHRRLCGDGCLNRDISVLLDENGFT